MCPLYFYGQKLPTDSFQHMMLKTAAFATFAATTALAQGPHYPGYVPTDIHVPHSPVVP